MHRISSMNSGEMSPRGGGSGITDGSLLRPCRSGIPWAAPARSGSSIPTPICWTRACAWMASSCGAIAWLTTFYAPLRQGVSNGAELTAEWAPAGAFGLFGHAAEQGSGSRQSQTSGGMKVRF